MPDDSSPRADHTLSRRRLLGSALATGGIGALGAAAAGPAGATARLLTSRPGAATTKFDTVDGPAAPAYRSRPDLLPPKMQVAVVRSDPAAGLVVLTPNALPTLRIPGGNQVKAGLGEVGVMIVDERGELVFMLSLGDDASQTEAANLQVQTYEGKPVLTYWVGHAYATGVGTGYILDTSYRRVATVNAGNGLRADLHEFQLTPQNTALVTAYAARPADLSSVGGPSKGYVLDSAVQEIDVKTGRVLLDWRSFDHVPLSLTYAPFGPAAKGGQGSGTAKDPFDYFHVNSIAPYGDNELLVSSRNTWALYRIDRKTGQLIARINGRSSDYKIGPGANFYWQHHARLVSPGVLTVFDDGATPPEEPTSRGLVLSIDDTHRTVTLKQAFVHPTRLLTPFEGSMQLMSDGSAFVGWGGFPYYTHFAKDGSVMLDGRFPTGGQSYRAFRSPWSATPAAPPDIVVQADTLGGQVVYVSWNGATDVAQWQVLNGKSASSLAPLTTVHKAGFETAITCQPTAAVLAVAALDASGKRIGLSNPVTVTLPAAK